LIRATRELLAIMPPAKVTRAAVARHAGADPALIRYYFSDRSSLLLAVVRELIVDHDEPKKALERRPAPERLRAHLQSFFEFNAKYPFFHRLLVEEIATSESKEARALFHRFNQLAIETHDAILKAGARDKSLRRIDPALLHIAVVGMCEFFLASRVLLQDTFGSKAGPQRFAKRYAQLITDMVVDGIRPR
jgi:TetR/AcrR family transcriptional regulator